MTCLGWLPWLLAALVPGPEGLVLLWERSCANCGPGGAAGAGLRSLLGSQPGRDRHRQLSDAAPGSGQGPRSLGIASAGILELFRNIKHDMPCAVN